MELQVCTVKLHVSILLALINSFQRKEKFLPPWIEMASGKWSRHGREWPRHAHGVRLRGLPQPTHSLVDRSSVLK